MFLDADSEHLVVFAKLQPFLESVRETIGEPDYLGHLEKLVMKVPNIGRRSRAGGGCWRVGQRRAQQRSQVITRRTRSS